MAKRMAGQEENLDSGHRWNSIAFQILCLNTRFILLTLQKVDCCFDHFKSYLSCMTLLNYFN